MKLKKYSAQKSENLNKKLLSYSALTGAFLASAASSDAQVVYTDVNPDAIIQGGILVVDLDNDAVGDVTLAQGTGSTATFEVGYAVAGQEANALMGTGAGNQYVYPSRLAAGALINSAGPWLHFSTRPTNWPLESFIWHYATGASNGNWAGGQTGYLGIRFMIGTAVHYGWLELEGATGGTMLTLKGYAYEQIPDSGILAGDTATITAVYTPAAVNYEIGNFFPNPGHTHAQINIASKETAEISIDIINGMGQVVAAEKRKILGGKNILKFNFSELTAGTYFAKITNGSSVNYRKIVVGE